MFDGAFVTLNDKVKEDVKKLVTAKKLTSDEVENYIQSGQPMYSDIYKILVADGTLLSSLSESNLDRFMGICINGPVGGTNSGF